MLDAEDEEFGGGDESMVKVLAGPRELTNIDRLETVREYLRRIGEITKSVMSGGHDALLTYLKGRLYWSASDSSCFSLQQFRCEYVDVVIVGFRCFC